jgi:hypothetical protein
MSGAPTTTTGGGPALTGLTDFSPGTPVLAGAAVFGRAQPGLSNGSRVCPKVGAASAHSRANPAATKLKLNILKVFDLLIIAFFSLI